MRRVLTLLFALLPCTAMASAKPDFLIIRVGGFLSENYSIELKPQGLEYCYEFRPQPRSCTVLHPSPAQWYQFARALQAMNVWQWKKSYFDPHVMDGTQWYVKLQQGKKAVESQGSNAYPQADGSSNESPETSETFERLMQAIRDLTGKEFR